MKLEDESNSSTLSLEQELSRYWFCSNDRNMLQIHHSKQSQNPYFVITRQNIDIGVQNAIALKKITPEAKEQTLELLKFIFERDPSREMVDLVGVRCNVCGAQFSAPKLAKIEEGDFSKDWARALFESTRALETKNFGPFRVVDHFGLGRYVRGDGQSATRGIFWVWILGLRTIFMIIFLYYLLGLEVKVGRRWLPLGPVLFIGGLIALIYISFYYNVFEVLNSVYSVFFS